MDNVDGSFYDFDTWLCRGTQRERLSAPPDAVGRPGGGRVGATARAPDHERDAPRSRTSSPSPPSSTRSTADDEGADDDRRGRRCVDVLPRSL